MTAAASRPGLVGADLELEFADGELGEMDADIVGKETRRRRRSMVRVPLEEVQREQSGPHGEAKTELDQLVEQAFVGERADASLHLSQGELQKDIEGFGGSVLHLPVPLPKPPSRATVSALLRAAASKPNKFEAESTATPPVKATLPDRGNVNALVSAVVPFAPFAIEVEPDSAPLLIGNAITEVAEIDSADLEETATSTRTFPGTAGPPPPPAAASAHPPPVPPPAPSVPPPRPSPGAPPPPPSPSVVSAEARPRSRSRRREKQWFEEVFDDDFLRTQPRRGPEQLEREIDFLSAAITRRSDEALLDLGCGPGNHAIELSRRGYSVTGLDLSLLLLIRAAESARRLGINVNFVHGDMREMSFDNEFDAAYSFGSTFGYFDDDANRHILSSLAKALRSGGRLLLDLPNRDYLVRELPTRVWWEGEGCMVLEEVDFNYFASRLTVQRTVVFEDGRQLEQEISIRAYSLHEIGKLLHHCGFKVIEISGQMAMRGHFFGADSRSLLVIAEKRPPSTP